MSPRLLFVLSGAALLAACSTTDGGDAGVDDGGPSDSGSAPRDAGRRDAGARDAGTPDAGNRVDAGATLDAGGVDAGVFDAGPLDASDGDAGPHAGIVEVSELSFGGAPASATLLALFGGLTLTAAENRELPGCTATASGDCIAVLCTGPPPTLEYAGTITVSVAATFRGSAGPSGTGAYLATIAAGVATGETLDISASGWTVPPFTGSVDVAAAPVAVLPTKIALASALTLTWDPSVAASEVAVSVVPTTHPARATVTCLVPASTGSVVVAPELLSLVGAGPAIVTIGGVERTVVDAGSYSVGLRTTFGSAENATVM